MNNEITPAEIRALMRQKGLIPYHPDAPIGSEEHTSELQSHSDLVCRLLLEKKKNTKKKKKKKHNRHKIHEK